MSIDISCPSCSKRLRVSDKAAGKKAKCPDCQGVISIPEEPVSAVSVPPIKKWHLKVESGEDYGPIPRKELDQWFEQGRITADCQVLQEGADQWQWASDIYPSLAPVSPAASDPVPVGIPAVNAPAPSAGDGDNPFQFGQAESNLRTNVTSRISKRRSAQVDFVAIAFFIYAAATILRIVLVFVIQMSNLKGSNLPVEKSAYIVGFIFAMLFMGVLAVFLVVSGLGISKRQNWGRIMGLIVIAIAGLLGLLMVGLAMVALAINYAFLVLANSVVITYINLIVGLLAIGISIYSYVILLTPRYGREFR